jgi:hypothetical protein
MTGVSSVFNCRVLVFQITEIICGYRSVVGVVFPTQCHDLAQNLRTGTWNGGT